jgi:hypothetical protein
MRISKFRYFTGYCTFNDFVPDEFFKWIDPIIQLLVHYGVACGNFKNMLEHIYTAKLARANLYAGTGQTASLSGAQLHISFEQGSSQKPNCVGAVAIS